MEYLYLITEANVNGAGEDANEFIKLSAHLQPQQTAILQNCLEKAKRTAPEDSSTADIIELALEHFEAKTGIIGKICGSPFCDCLRF